MNSKMISIALNLYPDKDIWKLTQNEINEVMEIYYDYY
jgi:hypothetical protein